MKRDRKRKGGKLVPIASAAELANARELDAMTDDRGLLVGPRPSVDIEKLEQHLREALRLLHVDLEDENLVDTPRRWTQSLITMTSGFGWLVTLGLFIVVSWIADKWARSDASQGMQYLGLGLYVVAEAIIFLPLLFIAAFYSGDPAKSPRGAP